MNKLYTLLLLPVALGLMPLSAAASTMSMKLRPDSKIITTALKEKYGDAVRKAPAARSESEEWKPVGTGKYTDDIMTTAGVPSRTWEVEIYESAATPGYYRVENPYGNGKCPYFEQAFDCCDFLIHAENPEAVYMEYVELKDIDFGLTAEDEYCPAYTCDIAGYYITQYGFEPDMVAAMGMPMGRMLGGCITFEKEQMMLDFPLFGDGLTLAANIDGLFCVALPGASDYSFSVTSGDICTSCMLECSYTAGADVKSVRFGVFEGLRLDDEKELVEDVKANGREAEGGIATLAPAFGVNTAVLVALAEDGTVVGGEVFLVYGQQEQAEEWKSIGMGEYSEGLLSSIYSPDLKKAVYEVEVQESVSTPGRYRLVDPYGPAYPQYDFLVAENNILTGHDHHHYMVFDATDPERVMIEASPIGMDFTYGQVSVFSVSWYEIQQGMSADHPEVIADYGTLKDGKITFPGGAIFLYMPKFGMPRGNTNHSFYLTLPKEAAKATVFAENFEGMTAGSEETPDATEISADKKIDTALTHGYQWQGRGIHQAGGAVAVLHFEQSDWFGTESVQGYIQTPYTDVRLDGGTFTVRFRAKAHNADAANLHLEVYDPYTTNSLDAATLTLTGDWASYEATVCHPGYGNHLAYLQFASDGDDWLLDDFEIVQNYEGLMPPVAHFAKNVDYDHFTANWNAVPLATSYLVSVFSVNPDETRDYLVQDAATTECELTVNGTEKGKTYYYTVRSVNDLYTSDECEPYKVHVPLTTMDTPVTLPATDISSDGFTANWEPVFRAMGYIVTLKREHVAEHEEEFVVLHEDFDKLEGYAGYEDYPMSFYYNIDDYTTMPGWTAPSFAVYATSKFGIDNYWKQYEGPGELISPSLDLSASDGKFTVMLSVLGTTGDTVTVDCGDTSESHKLTADRETFSLSFSNGSSDSVLKFTFDGSGTLLFDDIAVSQTVQPGSIVTENVGTYNTVDVETAGPDTTSESFYTFTGLNASNTDVFVYTVKAWSWSLGEDGVWGPTVYSEVSEPRRVDMSTSGIAGTESAAGLSVSVDGSSIVVTTPEATTASIYNAAGAALGHYNLHAGANTIPAPASGLLIVRAGTTASKIVVK